MLADSKITLNANTAGGLTTPGAMTLGSTYTIGLKPCSTNQVLQYSGTVWNCSSAGAGTITGVTAGTDLTGGGTSGAITLNVDTTKIPQLKAANTFTGNQTITGNVSDTGNFSATGSITGQTGVFTAGNSTQVVNVTQSGTGSAVVATATGTAPGPAILGNANSSAASNAFGVEGESAGASGFGVVGVASNTSTLANAVGVAGVSSAPDGTGVFGESADTTANGVGLLGYSGAPSGFGLFAYDRGTNGSGIYGMWDQSSTVGSGAAGVGIWGDSSNGVGIYGTSDNFLGIVGASQNSVGIKAVSASVEALYATGSSGVEGFGTTKVGVYGIFSSSSSSGSGWSNVGSLGDSACSSCVGVLGTVDDGNALFGVNNSVNHETLYVANNSGFNGGTPLVARFAGPGASTYCYIPRDSNDNGTGDLVCTGSKAAAVPVEGNRMVRLYAVEAAENWFEDAGSGQLTNGVASVVLDQTFGQTVNGELDYHVFLTPNGDCDGLYVTNKTARGFEVRELHGGHSGIAFDYRIMVRRKGFERVRMQDVTAAFAQMSRASENLAAAIEVNKAKEKNHPSLVIPGMPKKTSRPVSSPSLPFVPPQHIAASTVSMKK